MGVLFGGGTQQAQSTTNYNRASSDHTVTFWARLDVTGTVARPFGNTGAWEMRTNTSTVLTSDLLQAGTLGTATLTFATYEHIAVVQNVTGGTRLFYIDGVLVNTIGSASFSGAQNGLMRIGNAYGGSSQAWNGALDDLRVYDRILSPNEIETIRTLRGQDYILDGLAHWWPMNEGAEGTTITGLIDIVGGINCTTITGTPTYNYDAGITYE